MDRRKEGADAVAYVGVTQSQAQLVRIIFVEQNVYGASVVLLIILLIYLYGTLLFLHFSRSVCQYGTHNIDFNLANTLACLFLGLKLHYI